MNGTARGIGILGTFLGLGVPRQACPASRGAAAAPRDLAAIGQLALRISAQAKALDHHWAELALLAEELKTQLKTIDPAESEIDRFALHLARQVNHMSGAADLAVEAARISEKLSKGETCLAQGDTP